MARRSRKKTSNCKETYRSQYSEEACYFAQQAAEIALKGYAKYKRIKLIGHSIVNHLHRQSFFKKFVRCCYLTVSQSPARENNHELDAHIFMEKELLPLLEMGAFLDDLQKHHYPHHLEAETNNKPTVTLRHAHQAIKYATKIIQWVTTKLTEEKAEFRVS
ncbi:MAG: HEPN domain-containing protein [Candidatus Heimdallarchaeaceae archaeon]